LPSISWSTFWSCWFQINIQYSFGNSIFFHSPIRVPKFPLWCVIFYLHILRFHSRKFFVNLDHKIYWEKCFCASGTFFEHKTLLKIPAVVTQDSGKTVCKELCCFWNLFGTDGYCITFCCHIASLITLLFIPICWHIYTDMRHLTMGIRSEKCVIRQFRHHVNMYLHKPR
jgi:hypothetical protein